MSHITDTMAGQATREDGTLVPADVAGHLWTTDEAGAPVLVPPRYLAVWNGGASYSPGTSDDAETFATIDEAVEAMRERRRYGRSTFRYVVQGVTRTDTPAVDGDAWMSLWRVDGWQGVAAVLDARDAPADVTLAFGPRGGVVRL
jgi:hypothetical protein